MLTVIWAMLLLPQPGGKGGYEVSLGLWSKVGSEAFNIIIEALKKLEEAAQ